MTAASGAGFSPGAAAGVASAAAASLALGLWLAHRVVTGRIRCKRSVPKGALSRSGRTSEISVVAMDEGERTGVMKSSQYDMKV